MESNNKAARKENPRAKANPISAQFFLYMLPVFWRNYKKGLKEEDLYEVLEEHKCSSLGDALEEAWKASHKAHPKYALHLALLKVYGREFAFFGFIRYVPELFLLIVPPFSIRKLITYFEKGPPTVTEYEAYIYAGAIVIALLINTVIVHPALFKLMTIGMKMRVSCSTLLYRKCLRLSATALGKTTVGQAVNLLSNDVRKFDERFVVCHYLWMAPLQVAVGTYLLYQVIGISAFTGIGFLLLFVPLQVFLGRLNSTIRRKTAVRTDERVRLMNEILSGIQVIKMYTWEKPFAKLVSLARRHEIKAIRSHFYVESIFYGLSMFLSRTAIFISIVVYVYLGHGITADVAYSVTIIYTVLRGSVTLFLSFSIIAITEVNVSVSRLNTFLTYDETLISSTKRDKKSEKNGVIDKYIKVEQSPKITLKGVCAKWIQTASDYNLTDIDLNIDHEKLVAVIGMVGSGKTTLLNTILREIPLSSGELNIVGTLSYASQEPWLFSSSVKQNILFGNAYEEERYKSVIRVCALESDLEMFPYGDRTIVSEKGKSLSGGQKARINLARCVYKRADIYLLDDPLSAVDSKVGKQLYNNCIREFLSDKTCILITHQLQFLTNADKIVIMDESRIVADGKFHDLQNTGLDFAKLLAKFQGDHQENNEDIKSTKAKENEIKPEESEKEVTAKKETGASGSVGVKVYAGYIRAGGGIFLTFLIVVLVLTAHVVGRSGDYFVSYWVNLEQAKIEHDSRYSNEFEFDRRWIVNTYLGIIIATIIFGLAYPLSFYTYFMRASTKIHDTIFNKISFATMRFFNDNPTGRILNRFSKDMGITDEYMPYIMLEVVEVCLVFIGTMALSSIINPHLLIPTAILMVIFYGIRTFYLHTSRSVKRIEGITRSPIFNHLGATMSGLSTIRAFSAEKILVKEFEMHQDLHSSAWHLYISSNKAFALLLDLICTIFISCAIFSLVLFNNGYYGGEVGLVLTQVIGLCGLLQWGMRQWTELENNMTSVERLLEYTKQETEPVRELTETPPKNWPAFGKIVFQNVSMRYNPDDVYVLKNLTFTINPCEKIGVVGRTGAGKSSTLAALFQLYNVEGSIIIDEIDTNKLPLELFRSKISIIPQEPVLFSGTLRSNLDPFDEFDDATLWNAIEQVELKETIGNCSEGLSSNVTASGTNYSVGQRQLICLARALVRNNKILVMDEATANVDHRTDALIQRTIRKSFADCTVVTIAHRLNTVMDSDRVMVMDGGEVLEFDHPYILIQKTDSVFYSMVQTSGNSVMQEIKAIAKESFLNRK